MSIPHLQPNEVCRLLPNTDKISSDQTATLFKSSQLQVLRMALPAGKTIAEHKAPGDITVQCLAGRISFLSEGKDKELTEGSLIYLTEGAPHSLRANENSVALVTIALPRTKSR